MGIIASLFSGGVVSSVERIASEFIETDMESAEAKALMIKTLDPNGLMRRDLSRFAGQAARPTATANTAMMVCSLVLNSLSVSRFLLAGC